MPENLYPQLPTAPSMSQESFNIEMVRKYYQDIANLKEKYNGKQQKYKNAYNRLLHASTGASTVGVISGVSTIGTAFTIVGLPVQFSSVHLFHQFMNTKEYTFTIKMYKTSRKKERKRQTVNYYKNQI